jgi:tripartite-type tricarboxylate transporter receptor subunit TctC
MPERRALLAWLGVAALPLHAQDRSVRFIAPAAPGGISDLLGRLLAEGMAGPLGQPIVVENRAGASGLIGTQAVVHAPADGRTVLVTSLSNQVMAPLLQKAGFDPEADLQPVGLAVRMVGLLLVHQTVAARSLKDFIALARTPGRHLAYGSAGQGSANHIAVEQFKAVTAADLLHVPYKGGAPAVTALMGGEVQFALLDFGTALTALKSGQVRALAQTGTRRHVALPDIPTLAEAGVPAFDPGFWVGLAVPRGTPAPAVAALNGALQRALDTTAFKARAQANGWVLAGGPPQALAQQVHQDLTTYRPVVQRVGLAGS